MKVRNGFVSNSSSSSFLVLIKKDDYKKIEKSFTELEKEIIKWIGPEADKVFGIDVVALSMLEPCGYSRLEAFSTKLKLTGEEAKIYEENQASGILDNILDKLDAKNIEYYVHSDMADG